MNNSPPTNSYVLDYNSEDSSNESSNNSSYESDTDVNIGGEIDSLSINDSSSDSGSDSDNDSSNDSDNSIVSNKSSLHDHSSSENSLLDFYENTENNDRNKDMLKLLKNIKGLDTNIFRQKKSNTSNSKSANKKKIGSSDFDFSIDEILKSLNIKTK